VSRDQTPGCDPMREQREVDILTLVKEAQSGDDRAREELIRRYTPFVMSAVSRAIGRYVQMGRDDESSIGLMAFNEALGSFDSSRSTSFLGFSETVIKRRLIDHMRKRSSRSTEIPFSSIQSPDEDSSGREIDDAQISASVREYSIRNEDEERRSEIAQYSAKLAEFGISFKELASVCPKHEDARVSAIHAARIVSLVKDLREYLYSRRELPLRELAEHVSVSRKTLERQRKYIIAVSLIFIERFDYLMEFVDK